MPKQTIANTDVASKRVLVRVDFNVPLDNGAISDDRRIRAALPTIKSIADRGGRAVLMSHLGRPGGEGYEAGSSLEPVAKRLGELLDQPVLFPSQDCTDDAAAGAINAMADGQVLLLENLRFHAGEKSGDAAFADRLASYAEVYVNDAFGTCHRTDASMLAVPQRMGDGARVVGFLVEKEIKYLSEAIASPAKPFTIVLGGAKVSDKLPAIENLLPKADHIVIGGAMAYTFLKALGHNVGSSRVEEDRIKEAKHIIALAGESKVDLHLPIDHVCSTQFTENAGDLEEFEDHIKDGYMGLDIGPKSRLRFTQAIKGSKTVVWNGPMGVFEWRPFRMGTRIIAEAIADATDAGCTSVVGGGDSAAAAETFGVASRLSHVSTGGGASLAMLEGKPFEAVELLDDA